MNSIFFVCTDCKKYTDAGYRWAYWTLEKPGIVNLGKPFSADAVFAATEYWNPPPEEGARWLIDDVLPTVRDFLTEHKQHKLIFSDLDVDGDVFADYVSIPSLPDVE
jgi:hypothetical protein